MILILPNVFKRIYIIKNNVTENLKEHFGRRLKDPEA
jgi:hypothetical protein